MTEKVDSVEIGKRVLQIEGQAVLAQAEALDDHFAAAVDLLLHCRGKVVVTGVGKSGAIARKIAGTLSSTGTPALFLHPAEGVHGDLGVVAAEDVVVVLSYSGESDEVINIMPAVKRIGAASVALTRAPESSLARHCNVVLQMNVASEACPMGLAPTASTTTALALGDALAIAVMEARHFTREDYAQFHPAGALGRQLILRVSDLMRTGSDMALCSPSDSLRDVMFAITKAGAGAACIVDESGSFAGVITDGDVRRRLLADESLSAPAHAVMTASPLTISPDELAVAGLRLMEERKIGDLPVIENGRPVGVLMLKDLTRAGLV